VDATNQLAAAIVPLKPTSREVGALYQGWQSGTARTRELILASPHNADGRGDHNKVHEAGFAAVGEGILAHGPAGLHHPADRGTHRCGGDEHRVGVRRESCDHRWNRSGALGRGLAEKTYMAPTPPTRKQKPVWQNGLNG
jgi:hypothetical protein